MAHHCVHLTKRFDGRHDALQLIEPQPCMLYGQFKLEIRLYTVSVWLLKNLHKPSFQEISIERLLDWTSTLTMMCSLWMQLQFFILLLMCTCFYSRKLMHRQRFWLSILKIENKHLKIRLNCCKVWSIYVLL